VDTSCCRQRPSNINTSSHPCAPAPAAAAAAAPLAPGCQGCCCCCCCCCCGGTAPGGAWARAAAACRAARPAARAGAWVWCAGARRSVRGLGRCVLRLATAAPTTPTRAGRLSVAGLTWRAHTRAPTCTSWCVFDVDCACALVVAECTRSGSWIRSTRQPSHAPVTQSILWTVKHLFDRFCRVARLPAPLTVMHTYISLQCACCARLVRCLLGVDSGRLPAGVPCRRFACMAASPVPAAPPAEEPWVLW
jgi:hypothetical protein